MKATIISTHVRQDDDAEVPDEYGSQSLKRYAIIEFNTGGKSIKTANIQIAKKHLTAKYKGGLPIIYQKKDDNRPIIDETLYIYQYPISMIAILFILILIYFILKSNS